MKLQTYLYSLYRNASRTLLWSIPLSIFQSFLLLPIPLLVRFIFDRVVPQKNLRLLMWYGAVMLILYLMDGLLALKIRASIQKITKETVQQWREDLLNKFYAFSHRFQVASDRSKIHTIITQDTERLDAMTGALLAQFVPALLTIFGLSIVLIVIDPFLFLITICFLPLLFGISRAWNSRVRKATRMFHRSFEVFSKGILFVLQNVTLTKTQSVETIELQRQTEHLKQLKLHSRTMAWLRSVHFAVQNLVAGLTMIVILIAGGIAVMKGSMTIGALLSFYVAVALWKNALSSASQCIPQIIEGMESIKTLSAFLETNDPEPYMGTKRITLREKISLEQVTFSFNEHPLLNRLDLEICPGQIVAIIGPNGAGKTTIVNLILGFYRPQQGTITADQIPYSELDLAHLRRQFGVVSQDPIPFHGTILENICYGHSNVSQQRVGEVAELAGANFIQHLPESFNTVIGEQGMMLSGGQRQQIAIARALLMEPALLILDEPTKHLDRSAIQSLIQTLQQLPGRPAILVISHEVGFVSIADEVYILKNGTLSTAGIAHGIA